MNTKIAALALASLLASCATGHGYEPMDPDALMGKVMKLAAPTDPHKQLARQVGDWTVTWKMYHAPDAPPEETTGTAKIEMILGGRFLRETNTADFNGVPFQGQLLLGHNNQTGKYESVWIDSFSSGVMTMTGTADDVGKVITMEGLMRDPQTPQGRPFRIVSTMVDADNMLLKMFDTAPDGKKFLSVETTYVRR